MTQEIREFLEAGLTPIGCHSCPTSVLVKKTSPAHTSIQWTGPTSTCPELGASGEPGARIDTCPKLRTSIELAVSNSLIQIPDA
jgi:hypothetical protein